MSNWLITLVALILLLAVLDGVRRAIMKQRAALKVSRNLSRSMRSHLQDEEPEEQVSSARTVTAREEYPDPEDEAKRRQIAAELPGSVRVVQRRAPEDAIQINRQVQKSFFTSRKPLAGSSPQREVPEQASLNLQEQVPTLMDSVLDAGRREPSLDETDSAQALNETADIEPEHKVAAAPIQAPTAAPALTPTTPPAEKRNSRARAQQPVDEVLILNLMAPAGDYFEGNDLLRVLLAEGLRFGDMNIFHYHAGAAGEGPVLFSLANMVKPGTFDLSHMEEFTSPGISLFLTLPVEGEAVKAFDLLLQTARRIAEQLGGELKDENRSVFTAQTAEHYRQRVLEYQRRKALSKAPV
jgi:cell division protein ZipA